MAAATFYVEIKPTDNTDGTRSVRIRITRERKKAYHNTGIRLKVDANPRKSEWNPDPDYRKDNWITSRHPRAATLNTEIRIALDGLSAVAALHPTYSAAEIRQEYEKGAEADGTPAEAVPRGLFAYIDERVARKRKLGQFAAADNLYYAARKLREYAKGKDDKQLLTVGYLSDFAAHLAGNYAALTVKMDLSYLAGAYRKGVLEGRIDQMGDPFEDIHIRAPKQKQPRPFAKQLLELYALPIERKAWRDARNTLILLFLLHGARVSEAALLEWDKNVTKDFITYHPRKRGAKAKHVPRGGMIEQILAEYPRKDRYVLPYLTEEHAQKSPEQMYSVFKNITARINKALWRLTRHYGLPHLSTHMARRSFTDKALEELSDLRQVQELVGHASILTTEHYAGEVHKDKLLEASRRTFATLQLGGGTTGEQETESSTNHVPPKKAKRAKKDK